MRSDLHLARIPNYYAPLMNRLRSLQQILLLLVYGADALIIVGAGVMGLGFIVGAGGHLLLMTAPLGIAFFTGWAFGLSLKRRTQRPVQAFLIAATPLVFAPLWYWLIFKIVEANCAGFSCFN